MKKLFRSLFLAFGLAAGGVMAAEAGLTIFTGPGGTNPINFPADLPDINTMINTLNGLLNLQSANSNIATLSPMGRVYSQVGPTSIQAVGTTGVTVATFTVPSNSFDTFGRTMWIHMVGHFNASNSNSKSVACGWGGQVVTKTIATYDISSPWSCDFWVTEGVTANTQMMNGVISIGTTPNITLLSPTTTTSSTQASVTNASGEINAVTALGDNLMDNFEVIFEN